MFTIGMRAHDLGKQPLEQLAAELEARNIGAIQLALSKALTDFPYRPGTLNPGIARHIRGVLDTHGVHIAVLGAYVNLIHPDPAVRASEVARHCEHLSFARDFGCSIVGTETGHRSPDGSPDPETQSEAAFEDLLRSVETLVRTAERSGVFTGIEPVADKHPLSSIDRTVRLIAAVDSPALRIIFDPVNLIPAAGIVDQDDFLTSAFQAFGDRIVCIHAKDFRIENGAKTTLPAGAGELNYPRLFELLREYKPGVHILMEDTKPVNLEDTRSFLARLSA